MSRFAPVPLGELFTSVSVRGHQVQTLDYDQSGDFPIVDQGKSLIVGYTGKVQPVPVTLPVTVFGDHTREVKFVDFPFVAGADGTKVLRAVDGLEPRYVHALVSLGAELIANLGYSRHFKELREARVPFTRDSEEQRRIAAVLEAWDEAVATTERLIAAKRVRSRGLTQRLVEGSDAPRAELDTFATLVSDKVDPTNFGGVSVELDNIESRTGRRLGTTTLQAGAGVRHRYVEGDVLFGKLRPYLAKYIYAEEDGLTSTEVWVLRADRTVCTPRYLYYLVQSQAFAAAANKPTGSRMPRAEWEIVRETPLPLPTIAEQERVVRVLACAEADASSEDVILDRLRLQKRGLMRRLLTGAWRVPESIDTLIPGEDAAEAVEAAE